MKNKFSSQFLALIVIVLSVSHSVEAQSFESTTTTWVNEGFTEPFEDIDVAVTEMGIVDSVRVKPGHRVNKEQLLATLDSSVLRANLETAMVRSRGTAKLRAAEIEYKTLQTRFDKVSRLLEEGAARPEEVERARTNAEVARQEITAIGEQIEIYSWEVKELEARIEQRSIRSPIDGVVVDVYKRPGEHVSTNEPLVVRVVDLSKLRVIFHLPTANAIHARVNQSVQLLIPESNQLVHATVEYVSPITSADSGRVRVDLLIDNPRGEIRSGLRCRIQDPNLGQADLPTTRNRR